VIALAMAPWGSSRVAASYSDSHIAVFDHNAPSAGPVCHLRAPGHMPFKTSFYVKTAFSPCGTHLASGSCDANVYVWDVDRPLDAPAALAGTRRRGLGGGLVRPRLHVPGVLRG
jgi:denticleless